VFCDSYRFYETRYKPRYKTTLMRRRSHKEQKATRYLKKKIIEERAMNATARFYCRNPDVKRD